MKGRAASPALSENEVDIAGSLFANEPESNSDVEVDRKPASLDFGDLLNNGDSDGSENDDEAFIAMQQRSSNRKSSNLQGKTVKKGGGFQAMGKCPNNPLLPTVNTGLIPSFHRSQCESSASHHPERLLGSHPYPAQDHTPNPREARCRGHGSDWFRQNGSFRDSHD